MSFANTAAVTSKSWSDSVRLITAPRRGDFVRGNIGFDISLGAGEHTIYWRIRRTSTSGSLQLQGGGVLSIAAYPIKD